MKPYLLIVLVLCATAVPKASAQEGAPMQRALELFAKSREHYQKGEFKAAAELLEQAYEASPEPVLLYNLARARESSGDFSGAVEAYRAYLGSDADTEDREAIRGRIATLEAKMAEEERLRSERQRFLEEAKRKPKVIRITEQRSPALEWAPWILAGVGAATLGVGIGLRVAAVNKNKDAIREPIHRTADELRSEASSLASASRVLLIAGGAISLGGVAWGVARYVFDKSKGEAPPPSSTVSVGASIEGVYVHGTF